VNLALAVVFALIGLLAGGVINALADDLPDENRVHRPHYPDGTPRRGVAWLGTLAFLTGARVSPSGAKLRWRHVLVEIGLAILFAYVGAAYPFSVRSLFWLGYLAILLLVTVIDLEHRLILFIVMIPSYLFALVGAVFIQDGTVAFRDYVIGGLVGFGLFFLMYLGGRLFNSVVSSARGEELEEVAFGYGDVMLATLSGLMLGWQALIFAVTIAVFAGAAGALVYLAARFVMRGQYEMYTALPYGQYIVLGTVIMLLWREPVRLLLQGGK
jgi:leader peptidase (prepilin peptidase)/N-methyltransferase